MGPGMPILPVSATLHDQSNSCDVKKIRGLCLLCAVLLLALSYLYATWEKHPKMTAFSSGTDGDFSTLRKKNLCVPIVFLRVRLHV